MKDDIVDLLFDGEILCLQNADGTFSRCSSNELVGKDIEIVSSRRFSFQDLEKMFEPNSD